MTRIAIAQRAPRLLDLAGSLDRAVECVEEAAAQGADLVAFSETWLTGYPAWVFGKAGWDDPDARALYARLLAESPVIVPDDRERCGLGRLRDAASGAGIAIVMGLNERPATTSRTLHNSMAIIDESGDVAVVHRKLVPTHTERIVWAPGDAAGLRVAEIGVGRVGGLVCWENLHPLARHVLHEGGEQVHFALWPDMTPAHEVVSRSYAFEGRCVVVAAAQVLRRSDVPPALLPAFLAGLGVVDDEDDFLLPGGSSVAGPDGAWIVEPVYREEAIVMADIDLDSLDGFAMDLDIAGHSHRPDVFSLTVRRERPWSS